MATYTPKSSEIKVFPASRRGENQISARVSSEQNLTQMVQNIASTKSFILSTTNASFEVLRPEIQFIINGYYFTISNLSFANSWVDVYAYINQDFIKFNSETYSELLGDDTTYKGITFTNDQPDSNKIYLHILTRASNTKSWLFVKDSFKKFYLADLGEIEAIDCGIIGNK